MSSECANGMALARDVLTPSECAEYLGVTTRTIYRWRQEGLLPSLRYPHGTIRFLWEDVRAFREGCRETEAAGQEVRDDVRAQARREARRGVEQVSRRTGEKNGGETDV